MNVTLYKYTGERERVDKSSLLQVVLEVTGEFKAEVNVLTPSLFLTLPPSVEYLTDENGNVIDEVIVTEGEGVLDFNYFYIEEFHRYYYLDSFTISSKRLCIISGSVDPLYSFRDSVISNEAFVERNEFTYDDTIVDNELPFSNETDIKTEEIPSITGFKFSSNQDPDSRYIAVTTFITGTGENALYVWNRDIASPHIWGTLDEMVSKIGGNSATTQSSEGDSIKFSTASPGFLTITYIMKWEEWRRLLRSYLPESAKSYIKSVTAFPFDLMNIVKNDGVGKSIPFAYGDTYAQLLNDIPLFVYSTSGDLSKRLNFGVKMFDRYDFTKSEPFSSTSFYFPFVGDIPLPREIYSNDMVGFYGFVSLSDATGVLYIKKATGDDRVISVSFEVGCRVPLDQTNSQEIVNNNISNAISTSLAILSGVGSIGLGIANGGNPIPILSGIMSISRGVGSSVTSAINNIPRGRTASTNTNLKFTMPTTPRIVTISKRCLVSDMAKYRHAFGSPLMRIETLSNLSGFTKVAKIHLENCSAFDSEKSEIVSSLLSGVIL